MDKDFLMKLKASLETLDTRLAALEHLVNDVIIGGLESAANEYADEEHFNAFTESYGPMIAEISEPMKVLCGDDFDCVKELYQNLKEAEGYGTDGFDEKAVIEAKINELKDKLAALKSAKKEADDTSDDSEEELAEIFEEYK